VVADGVCSSPLVASHQSGINLFHLLSHKAKLRDASGVEFLLVAKCHRVECQQCVACVAHGLNVLLETFRGNDRAELTIGIDNHTDASSNGYPTNAGDKCACVSSYRAGAGRYF